MTVTLLLVLWQGSHTDFILELILLFSHSVPLTNILIIGSFIITTDSINAYILHNTTTGVTTGGITKTLIVLAT